MTTQCPRCGTPRLGEYPICQACGLDFRTLSVPTQPVYGAPAPDYGQPLAYGQQQGYYQSAPTPQPAAPTVCLRCYAPLSPGNSLCANCGYDNRAAYATPAQMPRQRSVLPVALALLGVGVLVVAGALLLVAGQGGGSSASPSASPTVVAEAPAEPTSEDTPAPLDTPTKSPGASATGVTPGNGTPEPKPAGIWTLFTCSDNRWSTQFPGTAAPTQSPLTSGTGIYQVYMTVYSAGSASGARYAVEVADFSSQVLASVDPDFLLTSTIESVATTANGTVVSSVKTTEGGKPARDAIVTAGTMVVNLRLWLVDTRMYVLIASAQTGGEVYPQYFFAAFTLK